MGQQKIEIDIHQLLSKLNAENDENKEEIIYLLLDAARIQSLRE